MTADDQIEFRAFSDFADSLRDEAEELRARAIVLCAVADVADTAAGIMGTECPGVGCRHCPAHIGSPGICIFSRVRDSITRAILKSRGIETDAELSPVIEVP